ncbi:MAG: MtrB/PioB family outer membrane beta-barrel protein [Proteobacteria bacterium]|nr:MtrB/PioB family outer membrane beta-barrel protein [Pseudomonadota bacterium]
MLPAHNVQAADDFHFSFQADDILYDTQSYRVEGDNYGKYKFNLFYDEIPHNPSSTARPFTNSMTRIISLTR